MRLQTYILFALCLSPLSAYSQDHAQRISTSKQQQEAFQKEPSGKKLPEEETKKETSQADEALLIRIHEKLAGLSYQFGQIDIEVKDGVVTLKGPVQNYAQKIAIVQAISSVTGVKSVQDNLTVRTSGTQSQKENWGHVFTLHFKTQHTYC